MKIKKIPHDFSICKVADYSKVNTAAEYCMSHGGRSGQYIGAGRWLESLSHPGSS